MSNRTNLKTLLPMLVFLLAMVGTTFAGPSLFPSQVGLRSEFNRRDSTGNQWTVYMETDHQKTIDSLTYFHLQRWNYGNDGAFEDLGYARLTEEAVYMYNPSGPDDLVFQKAPVGTKWSFYFPDPASPELDYLLTEITDIGPVTVPYGTFDTAYKHRKCSCENSDGSGDRSPYHYEWIVPGTGYVKQVNFWGADNPPLTMELVGTTFAEPLFPLQVGLRSEFNRSDGIGNEWTVQFDIDHQTTINSLTYFHLQRWNYENDGVSTDLGYVRLTDQAVYGYNPSGSGPEDDYLTWQKESVGTKWISYKADPHGFNYEVREITAIEPVTVPYGTFGEAYVHRNYSCIDPTDLSEGQSPYWYDWVVPGVAWVKEVSDQENEGDPTMTMELVDVIIPADIDIDPNMLNVQSESKWITWYIWLPEEYDVADIEPDSILLNGVIEAAWRWIDEEEQVLMAKFSRSDVQDIVEPGEVELTVSGELTDGTKFEGAVMITIID